MRKLLAFAVASGVAAGLLGQSKQTKSGAPACDRACLESFVNQYLDALVAQLASAGPNAAAIEALVPQIQAGVVASQTALANLQTADKAVPEPPAA